MADTVTRAANLRLAIPPQAAQATVALLRGTHRVINQASRYYAEHLLLMRQAPYLSREHGEITESRVSEGLSQMVEEARTRNGHPGPLTEEIAADLRALYAAIVPSSEEEEGSAQVGNRYLGPLVSATSKGGTHVAAKIASPPEWVEGVRAGDAQSLADATVWIETDDALPWLRSTGAPAAWVRQYRAADPRWPVSLVAYLDAQRAQVAGIPAAQDRLRAAGVLPLFPPFVARLLHGPGHDGLNPWDRLAFRLATGLLIPWETWCRKAADEHAKRAQRIEAFRQRHLTDAVAPLLERLRVYERERTAELQALPLGLERSFRVTPRQLRGWAEVRERWLRQAAPTEEALLADLAKDQTRRRGRFGDPHLLRWLARPAHHDLWQHTADLVGMLGRLNALEGILERSRETATLTLPDPVHHPKWTQWEPPAGSNLRTYAIEPGAEGGLAVTLPLLEEPEAGRLQETQVTLALAPSGQLKDLEITTHRKSAANGKGTKKGDLVAVYTEASGERVVATLKSADLLFDAARMERATARAHRQPFYVKFALERRPLLEGGCSVRPPPWRKYFSAARPPRGRAPQDASVVAGLRVLSVDLGLRTAASCSVYELRETRPPGKLAFPVPQGDATLWAVHERSFLLEMPGGSVTKAAALWRDQAYGALRRLRRALARYRRLYRLVSLEGETRRAMLEDLRADIAEASSEAYPFEGPILETLARDADAPLAVWETAVETARRAHRDGMRPLVRDWRRAYRRRTVGKHSGKSMWAIQYLHDTRRFLLGWTLAGRASGDVRRLDRDRGGVFAAHLLKHIDALKDDYRKTAADLIVQAARGFLRDREGAWERRYAPCPLIVFENLSRYRMRTDRPRRENSQLARWGHRAIRAEVEMQGQLYGIHPAEVGAAFTSRYHAASGTPGIRCHALREGDLDNAFFSELLMRENPGLDLSGLRLGDLVHLPGGEWFVAMTRDGLIRIHADINAAQGLHRRFWTRHGDAFRLPCTQVTDSTMTRWIPQSLGKRLLGALGGYGFLEPTGHESGSCRWRPLGKAQWSSLAGSASHETDESAATEPELEEMAALEEEQLERSGQVVVFFRDPSGAVFPSDLWLPSAVFWSAVKARALKALALAQVPQDAV